MLCGCGVEMYNFYDVGVVLIRVCMHLYSLQVVGMKGIVWKMRFISLYELASMYGNACSLLTIGSFVGYSINLLPGICIQGKKNT